MHTEDTMVNKIDLIPACGGLILVKKTNSREVNNNRISNGSKCCAIVKQGQEKELGWSGKVTLRILRGLNGKSDLCKGLGGKF